MSNIQIINNSCTLTIADYKQKESHIWDHTWDFVIWAHNHHDHVCKSISIPTIVMFFYSVLQHGDFNVMMNYLLVIHVLTFICPTSYPSSLIGAGEYCSRKLQQIMQIKFSIQKCSSFRIFQIHTYARKSQQAIFLIDIFLFGYKMINIKGILF